MNSPTNVPLEELEFIGFECPHCRTGIDFLTGLAGTAQGCPSCGQSLVVPRNAGQPATKIPLPLEGIEVTLRRLVDDDWKSLMAYWQGWDDVQLCDWLTQEATQKLTADGQAIHLGIARKNNPTLIGNFTLQFTDPTHLQAAFGVQVNHALMTDALFREACSALFVLCFGAMNLHRIVAQVPVEEEETSRLLTSVGMRTEGHYRQDRWEEGTWRDTLLFAFLQEDYEESRKA